MEPLEIKDIFRLLSHSRNIILQEEATFSSNEGWSLYQGKTKALGKHYPFEVIYLGSKTSRLGLDEAVKYSTKPDVKYVIFTPSLIGRLANIQTRFNSSVDVLTTKQFLRLAINEELGVYIEKIRQQAPAIYVDPQVEVPSGFNRKIPNPLLSILTDEIKSTDEGVLAVLLAEPGQGKTHLCRHLVAELAKQGISRQFVPLMVDSSQWDRMAIDDQRSIWKTIVNSFRHFEAPISWLEGHEDEFLRVCLKAGLFRIIFDGFDEYLLRNQDSIQPMEILEALRELSKNTGARIVITSRTSFWQTNLSEGEMHQFEEAGGFFRYRLLPFDLESSKNYFKIRLDLPKERDDAFKIFSNLRKGISNDDIVGRGFVLNLIADLAQKLDENIPATPVSLQWLMSSLCQREELRQELPINQAEQLNLFRMLASELASGVQGNTQLFDLCVEFVAPNLDKNTRSAVVEKLKHHPLVEYKTNGKSGLWSFKQDQVEMYLLVEWIVKIPEPQAINLIKKLQLDAGKFADFVSMIVEFIATLPDKDAINKIRWLRTISPPETDPAKIISDKYIHSACLPAAVGILYADKTIPKGGIKLERTSLLIKEIFNSDLKGLVFSGTVGRFDFNSTNFENCIFHQVTFANCQFSQTTTFSKCTFIGGGDPAYCSGFGRAKFADCTYDADSAAMINREQVREGSKNYTREDLRNDISTLVHKFVLKNRPGFRSIEARNLDKGSIAASRHHNIVTTIFSNEVLDRHLISGTSEPGLHVKETAKEALLFYSSNNSFTGALRKVFEDASTQIGI